MGNLIAWLIKMGVPQKFARIVAIIGFVLVLLLLIAAITTVSRCTSGSQKRAQSRLDAAQDQAATNSAADAVNTQAGVNANSTASEDLTRSNDADIRGAEGANAQVGAGVDAAGRKALCKRKAYRNHPKCKGVTP